MLDIEYKSDYIIVLNTQIEKESYDGNNSSTCNTIKKNFNRKII